MRKEPFFVYDYEMEFHPNGKSSTRPRVTMAIVPRFARTDSDQLIGYGVGFAICSPKDNPCKRVGRKQALKRAAMAIKQHDFQPPVFVDNLAGTDTISGFYVPADEPLNMLPKDQDFVDPYEFLSDVGVHKLFKTLSTALKK